MRRCTMQPRRAAQGKRAVVVVADARVRSTPPLPVDDDDAAAAHGKQRPSSKTKGAFEMKSKTTCG